MSLSYQTNAKIHMDIFPPYDVPFYLKDRVVIRKHFDGDSPDPEALSFALVDDAGFFMGLYFHENGFLKFFDFTAGNWAISPDPDARWMRDALLAHARTGQSFKLATP